MIDNSRKIKITSMKDARILILVPELQLRKEWARKGAVGTIPFDTLVEAYYHPGVSYLFEQGLLYIDDMEAKKVLGLEPEEAEEPINIIELTDAVINRALGPMPLNEFKNWYAKLSYEQKKAVAEFAIENTLINYDKDQIIKEDIKVDIIRAIELTKSNEVAPPATK